MSNKNTMPDVVAVYQRYGEGRRYEGKHGFNALTEGIKQYALKNPDQWAIIYEGDSFVQRTAKAEPEPVKLDAAALKAKTDDELADLAAEQGIVVEGKISRRDLIGLILEKQG